MEGHEKLGQKMLHFLVYHQFLGHLAILKDVRYLAKIMTVGKLGKNSPELVRLVRIKCSKGQMAQIH